MSRLANEHGAVNLGQGFPDFPGPEFVKEAARTAIDADLNQYALSHGESRLRAAVAGAWNDVYGMDVDPEHEITVTSGATEAIFDAIQALVGPGDEIVVFEPFYDSYLPSAAMAGASLRVVTLRAPDWSFSEDELAAAFGRVPGCCCSTLRITLREKSSRAANWNSLRTSVSGGMSLR
jgi:aminotransferase